MAGSDLTIAILKEIRRDVRDNSKRLDGIDKRLAGIDRRLEVLDERLDLTIQSLDVTNERLDVVESTLLTLARQQRIFMRHSTDLEGRVAKLEKR